MKGWLTCIGMFVAGVVLSDMVSPMMSKLPIVGKFFDGDDEEEVINLEQE